MAFKPFDFFRKRQKLFLAGLAIIAMFLFIGEPLFGFRSGRSKFVDTVGGWFGYSRNRIATVGGRDVSREKIIELRANRSAALNFIQLVQREGNEALLREAGFTDDDLRDRAKFDKRMEQVRKDKPTLLADLQQPREGLASSVLQNVQRMQENRIQAILEDGDVGQYSMGELQQLYLSPLSLVEFLYWRKRADDLGIVIKDDQIIDDLVRQVGREKIKADDLPGLVRKYKLNKDFESIVGALADEVRALIAAGTVAGPDRSNLFARLQGMASSGSLSTQATPLDLWEAYVDVKRQLEVGILDVPINQREFLDKIPDPPTDELKAYFEKYNKDEPSATRDTPGFKIPKLYQIAFVYGDLGTGTDAAKYYRRWVQAVQALDPITFMAEVAKFYEDNKRLRYRTVEDPFQLKQAAGAYVAGLAGVAAMPSLGVSGALPALRPAENALGDSGPRHADVAQLVLNLAGNAAAGWPPLAVLSSLPRKDYAEKFIPLDDLYDGIVEEITLDATRKFIEQDLNQLKSDLAAYAKTYAQEFARWRNRPGAKADKSAFVPPPFTYKEHGEEKKEPLDDYLKRFAQKRGLVFESMSKPRPKEDLFKEEDKTPLGSLLKPLFFRQSFMDTQRSADVALQQLTEQKGLFAGQVQAEWTPQFGKSSKYALHWKTQESEPRVPTFEEAKPQVLEAWKLLEKARTYAEERAQALAKEVAASKPDGDRKLKDLEGYHPEKTLSQFELQPVGMAGISYRQATVPVIEHPTADVVTHAINQLKEVGDTMVVTNKPKNHYYVLVLKKRVEPQANNTTDVKRFDQEVILPDVGRGIQVNSQPLADYVLEQKRKKYLQEWYAYLRAATNFDEEKAKSLRSLRDE